VTLPRAISFWLLALLAGSLLFAASAPSPLYSIYQQLWHFAPITITAIYATYAASGLAGLLTAGRLSDRVGRRPVVVIALLIQLAGMLTFIAADGELMLYLARLLQGLGTGVGIAAISAWLVDLQPADSPRRGGFVASLAIPGGLAVGAIASGILVDYGPDRLHLVYWLLSVFYVAALLTLALLPDLVERRPGALASLRPEIGVPPAARRLFAASTPSLVAIWALAGLYLSLGPSLAIALTQSDSHVAGGLVILALLGTATVTSILVQGADARRVVIVGSVLVIAGVGLTVVAVGIGSVAGLYAGSFLAGLGLGPAFSAIVRSLTPLAAPDGRAALLAAIYVVVYAAFSVPAVIAGFATGIAGLRATTYAYGVIVIVLALATTVAVWRRRESAARLSA
jgi:MFS family permease